MSDEKALTLAPQIMAAHHEYINSSKGSLDFAIKAGELLKEGDDYLVDPEWGHVGLGPKSRVTAEASCRSLLLSLAERSMDLDG